MVMDKLSYLFEGIKSSFVYAIIFIVLGLVAVITKVMYAIVKAL